MHNWAVNWSYFDKNLHIDQSKRYLKRERYDNVLVHNLYAYREIINGYILSGSFISKGVITARLSHHTSHGSITYLACWFISDKCTLQWYPWRVRKWCRTAIAVFGSVGPTKKVNIGKKQKHTFLYVWVSVRCSERREDGLPRWNSNTIFSQSFKLLAQN